MKTYAVRATKEEKNLYYILFMHEKGDENAILLRMADLIERSNRMEFDEVCSWPLALPEEEVDKLDCPHPSNSEGWFFPKRTTEEKWNDLTTYALVPPAPIPPVWAVIV